jgi:hypothetical protein
MSPLTQVKNTEPPVPEPNSMFEVEAFIIRSTMDENFRHTLQGCSVGWSKRPKIVHPCETTHGYRSPTPRIFD